MATFFNLVEELQTLINGLDKIVSGGDTETTTINGVNKDSISKVISDKFGQLSAMMQGRTPYSTKALLDASSSPTTDTLAEVWNDPIATNNGIYGYTGSAWVASSYSIQNIIKMGNNNVGVSGEAVGNVFYSLFESSYIEGKYYNDIGALVSHSSTKYTELIDIHDIETVRFSANPYGNCSSVFYAEDKVTILLVVANSTTATEVTLSDYPSAYYIGMSTGLTGKINLSGVHATSLYLTRKKVDKLALSVEDSVALLNTNSRLLVDTKAVINGGYYDTDGAFRSHGSTKYTELIDIHDIEIINLYAQSYGNSSTVFYAEDKVTVIASIKNTNTETEITLSDYPSAYYIGMSTGLTGEISLSGIHATSLYLTRQKVEDLALSVELLASNLESINRDTSIVNVNLPANIYLPQDKKLWLYDDSTILNSSLFEAQSMNVVVNSDKSLADRYINHTIIKGTQDHIVDIEICEPAKDINIGVNVISSKQLTINTKPIVTGLNINTLVIADSYFDTQWGEGLYNYMQLFAADDGNSINFKGTRTSYGNLGEARGSWSAWRYANRFISSTERVDVNGSPTDDNMCSPFMFSSDDTAENAYFSYSEYISTNGITDVDNIIFFLGMNGGDGENIAKMVDNIRTTDTTSNIFVCMIPPAERHQVNFNTVNRQYSRESRNKNYLDLFEGRESENIYVVPTAPPFSREHGLINGVIQTVQYPDELEADTTASVTTNHHPSSLGAKVLAETIYNTLLYVNS
jgi:hypothetical protein